jgi:hypothetical protein
MSIRRTSAGLAGIMAVAVMSCSEPTNSDKAAVPAPNQSIGEQVQSTGQGTSLSAFDLLTQQLAWAGQVTGSATPPTCTILVALSPALKFDRNVKIGNCGACIPGGPVLAVATSGAGAAGNTAQATARCGSTDVAGPSVAVDPGSGNVQLIASAGLQVAGVPACARSYAGGAPQSNRSFVCIFF